MWLVFFFLFPVVFPFCDDIPRSILPGLPPMKIISTPNDSRIENVTCLFSQFGNVSLFLSAEENPCFQLYTMEAEPWELHVLLMKGDVDEPMCEPRVYGPLPRVLQIRFVPKNSTVNKENVITLQLNSRGGHIAFDLDLNKEGDSLESAVRSLLELVENEAAAPSIRPIFKNYQRIGELYANPAMTKDVENTKYTRKTMNSMSMTYVSAFFMLPIIIFATISAYWLMWEKQPTKHLDNVFGVNLKDTRGYTRPTTVEEETNTARATRTAQVRREVGWEDERKQRSTEIDSTQKTGVETEPLLGSQRTTVSTTPFKTQEN